MPKIKNKSKQYLFKNKLNTRLKSKKELIKESFFMMIFSFFLLFINYLIPKKIFLISSFKGNLIGLLSSLFEMLIYSIEILIVLFICFTLLISIFFILGSINRIIKVIKPTSKKLRVR